MKLHVGWNKVFLKLPYVAADGVRLNKWLFTFVLVDLATGEALDNIIYSPDQSVDGIRAVEDFNYKERAREQTTDDALYDLSGHRLAQIQHPGIYVAGQRKVVVR